MKYKILFLIALFSIAIASSSYRPGPVEKLENLIILSTEYGEMRFILFNDTPIHRDNFLKLVMAKKYDETKFHRIIDNFMVQGGQLSVQNQIPGFDTLPFEKQTLKAEISNNHTHIRGALCAARTENAEMRSDLSQFYIVQNYNGTHFLDGKYTVFGQLMVGFEVLDKIAKAEQIGSVPTKDITMNIKVIKVKYSDLQKFYGLPLN